MQLKIGEMILELRKERQIRQEELADFLGVTKASVSKWETRQSYPDILLLPQIAAYFNISIDELMGYVPQLSKEQITKLYLDLADAFAEEPFEDVMRRSKELVKEYYSCYPFLINIAFLWTNHHMLASEAERRQEILEDIIALCDHIQSNSDDMGLQQYALVLKSMIQIQVGKSTEVIEALKPLADMLLNRLSAESVLIMAYQGVGDIFHAKQYNQVMMYSNMMNMIEQSITYINLNLDQKELCDEMIDRTDKVIRIYQMDELNPNTVLQFCYQKAVYYAMLGEADKAIEALDSFTTKSIQFLRGEIRWHGDKIFNLMDEWVEELPLAGNAPRNRKVVHDSLSQALENPAFDTIRERPEFRRMIRTILK